MTAMCGPWVCDYPRAETRAAGDRWECPRCGTAYRLTRPKPLRWWRSSFAPHGEWVLDRRRAPRVIDLRGLAALDADQLSIRRSEMTTSSPTLAPGAAAWLLVLIENAVPSDPTPGGPMNWEGKGRQHAYDLLNPIAGADVSPADREKDSDA